jgi:hypothetical protein
VLLEEKVMDPTAIALLVNIVLKVASNWLGKPLPSDEQVQAWIKEAISFSLPDIIAREEPK